MAAGGWEEPREKQQGQHRSAAALPVPWRPAGPGSPALALGVLRAPGPAAPRPAPPRAAWPPARRR